MSANPSDWLLEDRFTIDQLIRPMANLYRISAGSVPVAFVRQKKLAIKEDIRFYADESQTEELFRIKARSLMEFGGRYDVQNNLTDRNNVSGRVGFAYGAGRATVWLEPGEYRYRLLLVTPSTRRERDFSGRLELVVNLTEGDRSAMMSFPEPADADAGAFRLAFKYFRRVEGTFRVNPRAKVESVQVRVYETGATQPRATHSVSL